jgi:glucosamine 6-phosphate synthetase-like amidotransferase/phosphosugar isomerase protein
VIFLGRAINYDIASESDLKLMEISQIDADVYLAGEMRQ